MFPFLPGMRRRREFVDRALGHPANADILRYLQANADPTRLAWLFPKSVLAYGVGTHPDLEDLLENVAARLPGRYSEYLYGIPVIANPTGVICAFAWAISRLVFRLPTEVWSEALQPGGKRRNDIGNDWIQLDPWEVGEDSQGRIDTLRYWCEAAYEYADKLS